MLHKKAQRSAAIGIDIDRAKELWPATRHGRWMSEEYEPGLVSVIIPTYNRARLVIEAMDSVFAQIYRPIELIVVDDGSTDNTADLIEEWKRDHLNDEKFKLRYVRQDNSGAYAARNRGAAECRGEFVLWHDSDDIMYPRRLEIAVKELLASGADICGCGYEFDNGQIVMPPAKVANSFHCLMRLPVDTHMWLYRRSFLRDCRPWVNVVPYDDAVFFKECIFRASPPKITTIRKILYNVRSHSGSRLTGDHGESRLAFETRLDYSERRMAELAEQGDRDDTLRRAIAYSLCGMAIGTYKKFPDIYDRITLLIEKYGEDIVWGRTGFHRALWRLGGARACAAYIRMRRLDAPIRRLAKRLMFGKARDSF